MLSTISLAAAVLSLQQLSQTDPGSVTAEQKKRPPYVKLTTYDPDGIGYSYMGREIAQVMGHQGAWWLDRPERYREEAPQILLDSIGLKPGMTVVDLGAGSGYLSFPMAKRVLPGGKVIATEIQPEMLDIIKRKSKAQNISNVETVLGKTDDTGLKPETADLILLVDVYHEFDKPYEMTESMVKSLKKGGKLVLVEYRKEDRRVPIKEVHKMSEEQVRKEMALFPLKFVMNVKSLPRQHILIFEKA